MTTTTTENTIPAGTTSCNPTFFGAGRVENGRFIGFTGVCYRCQGKGYMTPADHKRCENYDRYHRRVYA